MNTIELFGVKGLELPVSEEFSLGFPTAACVELVALGYLEWSRLALGLLDDPNHEEEELKRATDQRVLWMRAYREWVAVKCGDRGLIP
jgi:hypothetical protein